MSDSSSNRDKFSALWLSHSSISDFLRCPALYYWRAIYKDPITGNKITRMEPPLALGQAVHDVIDTLSSVPTEDRMKISLTKLFEAQWSALKGKKGGFKSKDQEDQYFERGRAMVAMVERNPGPLLKKAVKIKSQDGLPWYWFDEEEAMILCGKIDWLEYMENMDAVHIIDFKTGKHEEKDGSLQLPIYFLLAKNTQKRKIAKASYWYLDKDEEPKEQILPTEEESIEKVQEIAKRIKLARQISHFRCPEGGCRWCVPLEQISRGKGEKVGESAYRQDIYII